MKGILSAISVLLFLPGVYAHHAVPKYRLPSAIRIKLDQKFPGWRFEPISNDVRRSLKEYFSPTAQPEFISGDFDGNRQLDYGLLIRQGNKSYIVAFLRKGDSYKFYLVDSNAGNYLLLWRKGDQGYSYETQKNFIFANDSIEAVISEKAATSYVYENGRFRKVITGD